MSRNKSNPIRTCISCGERRSKEELIRLVLDADGYVTVDTDGCLEGRGAYVCTRGECWYRLEQKGRLNRAFRRGGKISLRKSSLLE